MGLDPFLPSSCSCTHQSPFVVPLSDACGIESSDLSSDDQSRVTKQEPANLCAVSVLCAST